MGLGRWVDASENENRAGLESFKTARPVASSLQQQPFLSSLSNVEPSPSFYVQYSSLRRRSHAYHHHSFYCPSWFTFHYSLALHSPCMFLSPPSCFSAEETCPTNGEPETVFDISNKITLHLQIKIIRNGKTYSDLLLIDSSQAVSKLFDSFQNQIKSASHRMSFSILSRLPLEGGPLR